MHAFASFIMRGRNQAVMVAVVSMVLSLIIPPLTYVSGGVVALVALRRGWQDTAYVVIVCGVVVALLSYLANGQPWIALVYILGVWLPVAILGMVLRISISLSRTVQVATAMGWLMILAMYLLVDEPALMWQQAVIEPLIATLAQLNADAEILAAQTALLTTLAAFMTGIIACAMVLGALTNLLVGRWWQAILYNPGGFRQEFHSLQLGKGFAIVTLLVSVLSFFPMGQLSAMARELAMLMVSIVAVQGVSLVHAMVALKNAHVAWLVALYMLMFVALPQVVMVLALVALVDMWVDIRGRISAGGPKAGSSEQ